MIARGVRYGGRNALRRHDVHDRPDDAAGRFRARGRGARPPLDLHPRAHAHPRVAAHSAADGRRRARRGVQAHARPVRRAGDRRHGDRARPGRAPGSAWSRNASRSSPRRPSRPGRPLGRPLRLRHRLRLERRRDRAPRRDDAGAARRRPRAHARDAQLWREDAGGVPRQVRGPRAVVVMAEARAPARCRGPARAHRWCRGARRCSLTSRSTRTVGSRSVGGGSAPRCPSCTRRARPSAAIRRRFASCRSGRSRMPASSSTTRRSGSTRSSCACRRATPTRVLPLLDQYAELTR